MNLRKNIGQWSVAALCLMAFTAFAGNVTKINNNDALNLGTSWVGGTAPGTADVAVWDNTVATAGNCANTLGAALSWGGIQVLDPVVSVKLLTNGLATGSGVSIGSSGIDLGSATVDLWLAPALTTTADQTWTIGNGRTLTLGEINRNINIQNNVTVSGHIVFDSLNFQVQSGGTLTIANGVLIEPAATAPAAATVNVGANGTGVNTVNQSGGTFKIIRTSGTSGSPAASLSIASAGSSIGVYNITNGSLIDISPADTAWVVVGGGSSSTGTLNVDGTASLQLIKVLLGNSTGATGTMNISNGTVTVASTVFDIARSSGGATGNLNVYGGTLNFSGSMNLGRGPGTGTFNQSGGIVNLGGLNVAGASSGAGPGIFTISGGSLTLTNSLTLAANGSIGSATVNLDGGTVTVNAVSRGTGSGTPAFNLNGSTLKARANNGTFIAATVPAYVKAGGAIIDTAGFNVTAAAPLLDGTGGGGLTKLGLGRLTLSGTNTYTGSTLINAGELYLNTTVHTGGAITVNDGALFRTTLAASGTTLPCASLTLGTNSGATVEFNLGTNGNATVPMVYATNLTVKGTVSVNVFGTGMSQGSIPLIQYNGSISGGGSFAIGFVQGWGGYITNDTTAKQIKLVITEASAVLWRALVNTNWDTTTANWYDLSNNVASTFSPGGSTFFDDSTSNSLVNLTGAMQPGSVNINNNSSNYTFTGVGQIGGVGGLVKFGSAMVTMAVSNNYSGTTVISNGVFRLGVNNAIPGGVILEGRLEMGGFSDNIGSLNGTNGVVNNSSNAAVVLGVTGGTFAGQITNSGGSLTLNKSGGGTLTLLSTNGYSGGTSNSGGTLTLISEKSIGPGALTISGATLAWLDAGSHTLTNPVILAGSATFGNGANGPLTVANAADFTGGGRSVNCNTNTDVSFPNGFTNGWLSGKGGAGNLTVKNTTSHNPVTGGSGTIVFGSGATIFDNCAIIQENGNIRLRAGADNETSRLVITNGSSLIMTNTASQNFRFNDGGSALNTINILDLAGTLTITPYSGSSSKLQMGSSSDPDGQNILNLLPGGVLRVKQILDQGPNSSSIFNFNGGTLSPNSDEFASTFMQFLDACYVLDGGAIIDTAGWSVTIGQALTGGGSGGLTKQGLGTLYLSGSSTYTNTTLVSAGGLGGTGTIVSPVTIASSAKLLAGSSSTSIGTFTINNTVTFNSGSQAAMKISKISGSTSSDNIAGVTTLHYGGTLVVTTNIDMTDVFAAGDTFTLFSATSRTGSFAAYNLPALAPGLGWDTSYLIVDGSIRIKTVPLTPPMFNPPVLNGTNLVFSGSGGTANGTYYVYATTNITLPLASWTVIATNSFDGSGNFIFTNAIDPAIPAQFFDIYLLP